MAPQRPTASPSFVNSVQVVTLTIYSTGSSAGPTSVPASSGGGSDVPIGAIAGGAAGGAMLAVAMVLIWKYWGLVIKRTEKRKRKEVQEILTVRENTRRNAATRFKKPQSPLRPIFGLNPESRRVTFLTRKPTLTRGKNNDDSTAPAAISPTEEKEIVVAQETLTPANPGLTAIATEPTDNGPRQPSLRFASAPVPSLVYEPWEPEPKSESGRELPEEGEETNSHPPEPAPEPTPTPTPVLSTSHGQSGRSKSPTPSTSNHSSPSPSRPSRSTRMRTPTRLPDPPDASPIPVRGARRHSARPSSSTPSGSRQQTPISSPTASPRRPPSGLATPPTSASLVPPTVPTVSLPPDPVVVAGSSASLPTPAPAMAMAISPVTWISSPLLRHSVLASDRPVIMPRAKNAQATSPSESHSQLTLAGSSLSHVSIVDGEPSGRGGFPDSLRHADHSTATGTTGENAQRVSQYSTPSAYSDD